MRHRAECLPLCIGQWQLLQQHAGGAAAVAGERNARRQLFGSGEIVLDAAGEILALERDDALIA